VDSVMEEHTASILKLPLTSPYQTTQCHGPEFYTVASV